METNADESIFYVKCKLCTKEIKTTTKRGLAPISAHMETGTHQINSGSSTQFYTDVSVFLKRRSSCFAETANFQLMLVQTQEEIHSRDVLAMLMGKLTRKMEARRQRQNALKTPPSKKAKCGRQPSFRLTRVKTVAH